MKKTIELVRGIVKRKICLKEYESTIRIPINFVYEDKILKSHIDIFIHDDAFRIGIRGGRGLIVKPICSNSLDISLDKN